MWVLQRFLTLSAAGLLAGCVSIVGDYDAAFDTGLNQLSSDTAKLLAAARAGGPERRYASKEATAYYAASANLLDRLLQRAGLSRGRVSCTGGKALELLPPSRTGKVSRPEDYKSFDCREEALYEVRLGLDALEYDHQTDGVLTRGEASTAGGQLQTELMGAIMIMLENKPASLKGN